MAVLKEKGTAWMNYLWRYMDREGFVRFISQKSLYFRSAVKFDDAFEGSFAWGKVGSRNFLEAQRAHHVKYSGGMPFEPFLMMNIKTQVDFASVTYVNCWHDSPVESEAMWRLYCRKPETGVLIKTTHDDLARQLRALKLPLFSMKPVRYLENFWIKEYGSSREIYFSKRASFSHEKEYRAIFQLPYPTGPTADGQLQSVDLDTLLSEIRVSPLSSPSHKNEMQAEVERAGLELAVGESEIAMTPDFSVESNIIRYGANAKNEVIRLIKKHPSAI